MNYQLLNHDIYIFGWDMIIVSIDVGAKRPFLLLLSMCGLCVVVGTGYVLWVELPVQRRLCPIFVSSVRLPDIHEYFVG